MKYKALLLALVLIFTCLPGRVFAEPSEPEQTEVQITAAGESEQNNNDKHYEPVTKKEETNTVNENKDTNKINIKKFTANGSENSNEENKGDDKKEDTNNNTNTNNDENTNNNNDEKQNNNTDENNNDDPEDPEPEVFDPGTLSLNSSLNRITADGQEQTYTIQYNGDQNEYEDKSLCLYFDEGFTVTDLSYDECFGEKPEIIGFGYNGLKSKDLTSISSIQKIIVQGGDKNSIKDLKITGTYQASKLSDKFKLNVVFEGNCSEKISTEESIETPHIYLKNDTPELSASESRIYVQDETKIYVKNMNIRGTDSCQSYLVSWNIPDSVRITEITLPEFSGAECEVSVNSNILVAEDGVISPNTKGGNVVLKVTPTDSVFNQSKDMVISLRNITYLNKTINISGNGTFTGEATPEKSFTTKGVTVSLLTQSNPETKEEPQEEPETPSVIDVESEVTKKDDTPEEPEVIITEKEEDNEDIEEKEVIEDKVEKTKSPTSSTQATAPQQTTTDRLRFTLPQNDIPKATEDVTVSSPEKKPEKTTEQKTESKDTTKKVTDSLRDTGKRLLSNTNSLVDSVGTGLISSAVEDVDTSVSNSSSSSHSSSGTQSNIAPEVEEDTDDQIKNEVKKTVKENRSIQLFLGFIGLLGATIAGLAIFIRKMSKEEAENIEAMNQAAVQEEKDKEEIEMAEEQKKKFEQNKENNI